MQQKQKKNKLLILFFLSVLIIACSSNNSEISDDDSEIGDNGGTLFADFTITRPTTYIVGENMLYDTISLTMLNKSRNAVKYKWELIKGDHRRPENYFNFETTNGFNSKFTKNMKLRNSQDTCYFEVKLTAYDKNDNFKEVYKEVKVPMLKPKIWVDGVEVKLDSKYLFYYKNTSSSVSISFPSLNSYEFDIFRFNFAYPNFFPEIPYVFEPNLLRQTDKSSTPPHPDGSQTFYVDGNSLNYEETFDDPQGNHSEMSVTAFSQGEIRRNEYYKIFYDINAEFSYSRNGLINPDGSVSILGSKKIKIQYLPEENFWFN